MFDDLTVCTPLPRYLPFPKFLLDAQLSHTAKLLYALLLDRATLSRKNNWTDEQGRIYVVYPIPKAGTNPWVQLLQYNAFSYRTNKCRPY